MLTTVGIGILAVLQAVGVLTASGFWLGTGFWASKKFTGWIDYNIAIRNPEVNKQLQDYQRKSIPSPIEGI